jgi:putative membrane protein
VPVRLHPATAVRDVFAYGFQTGAFGFFVGMMGSGADLWPLPLVFALAGAGALAGVAYALARYLVFEYEVEGDTFHVVSGVFRRRDREIPLDRVQNVDVQRNAWQQLLGLAEVSVETAGGGGTEATLSIVSAAEAERLREVLRTGRVEAETESGTEPDERDPATTLFRLDTTELAAYLLTEFRPGALVAVVLGTPLLGDVATDALLAGAAPLGGPERLALRALTPDEVLALVAAGVPMVLAGGWVLGAVLAFNAYRGFVLGEQGDQLRYRRGLLTEYSGAIPLRRVQTLTLRENVLQRALGFASLSVDTAGYGPGDSGEGGQRSAIPMARRDRALALVRHLEDADADAAFTRPPKRARRRYAARYALVLLALTGVAFAVARTVGDFSLWWTPALLLVAVPPAAHLTWAHRGYAATDTHLLVRAGFWRRRTTVVPYDRLQTVHRSRSVFQRRRRLASVVADTASGAVLRGGGAVVFDLDEDDAAALATRLREDLQTALR